MHYSDFWAVEDWKILGFKDCYFFNEDETPFYAVNVQIGIMTEYKTTINGAEIVKNPITRWITIGELRRLKENSGVIVF